jgi:hypothetical protein
MEMGKEIRNWKEVKKKCDVKNSVCPRVGSLDPYRSTTCAYLSGVSGTVILMSVGEHLPNMIKLLSRDEIEEDGKSTGNQEDFPG